MPGSSNYDNTFLNKVVELIEKNLADERYGVSELAGEIGMSRSNLLRKIKKHTGLSVSQFVRQVRLENGMKMLGDSSLNISEIAFKVGFSSTSYFIKCFREHYGYPPGEAGRRGAVEKDLGNADQSYKFHQLAAIMFTDIQGYTALMQRDEAKAVEFRGRHRDIFNATTGKYNGKILQYYGDGTLSTFSSAIDAVKCGIEMQLAFREEPPLPVRIGIHTGDIIFTDDDIIGDGVNIASRIESLSAIGSVFISEKVYDEVKNQSGIETASMGMFQLKNVEKPMEVYAIANQGLVVPDKDQVSGKGLRKSEAKGAGLGNTGKKLGLKWLFIPIAAVMLASLIYFSGILDHLTPDNKPASTSMEKKSIAVLPFINDSDDSTNIYIINGLMESILNNLQKIEDLRVISRTSVEKYRNNPKLTSEIASELNVNYLLEGSGQKVGDQILLHVQLIDAPADKHLWGEQYNREAKDIFTLQSEVARKIADRIEVIITPEEKEQIEKVPTENLVAYDHFLKGLDLMRQGQNSDLEEALYWFRKAIGEDQGFALAYADMAITFYLLDVLKEEKIFTDSVNFYADQALLLDPQLPQSLIAKACFHMSSKDYGSALPYLEKALDYNPNSALVINILSDFYANHSPDPEKYLEYALKGISLDIGAQDSVSASIIYLHLSSAFMQSGFIAEAEKYINKSLACFPENLYSEYLKAYILYARDRDLQKTKDRLIKAASKDPARFDIIQEVGKVCYYMRDWDSAYAYYKKIVEVREAYQLDLFHGEDAKIGFVYAKMGLKEESENLFSAYLAYAQADESIYKPLSLAVYAAYRGDTERALEQMQLFASQNNYHYWIVLFLEMDPLVDNIRGLPGFGRIMDEIERNFWDRHKQIRTSLEEKGLI